jgi:hypothetical protein
MEKNYSARKIGFDYLNPSYPQDSLYGYGGYENWSRKSSRFVPHQFRNEIRIKSSIPKIFVSKDAYEDMFQLVDIVNKEVGWLGTVEKTESNDYLIKEIFLFEQKSHHTTCNITEEGLGNWAMNMMEFRPDDGMDIVNSVRFWGHSHVWMGTSPSGQDDAQMDVFAKSCEDFFIRGIINKSGRMEFTLYLYQLGVEVHDASWSIYDPNPDTARRQKWESEVKEKVGEFVYPVREFGRKVKKGTRKFFGLIPEEELPNSGIIPLDDESTFPPRFEEEEPNNE